MTTRSRLARVLAVSLFAALPMSGTVWADNHAAAPPTFIMESFACSYRDGKDADDLAAARDNYLKVADKAGIRKPRSLVWNRFKGGPDVDFLWINLHPDLATFAAHTEDMARPDMSGAVDRFNSMSQCVSNVSTARALYNGGQPPVTNPPGLVESYGCFFAEGRGPSDLPDLGNHIARANSAMDNTESLVVVGTNPMTPGPGTPHRFVFGVHEDMSTWAARAAAMQSSEAGQSLMRHFSSVFGNCYAALWTTQVMVEGDEP